MISGEQESPVHPPESGPLCLEAKALFTDCASKPVKMLDGIEVDLIAQSYELEGDIEIDGDVPDHVLLVVRNGGLRVRGIVSGNIVATGDITVEGNVSTGWLISKSGNISVHHALSRSRLIAKAGSVETHRMESPACVFAWNALKVRGDVAGGRLLGRAVDVEGVVAGAQVHSVGPIRAEAFEVIPRGPTILCLRDSISCEDYGRPMEEKERRLRRSIGKHVYTANTMSRLIRYASRDVNDSLRTTLYVLLGGMVNAKHVRTLRGFQCQANFLSEVTGIAGRIGAYLRATILAGLPADEESVEAIASEGQSALKAVLEDVQTMAVSFSLSHKSVIGKACTDLYATLGDLKKGTLRLDAAKALADDLQDRIAKWAELHAELEKGIAEQVAEFGINAAIVKNIETQPEKLQNMLDRVKQELGKRETSSERTSRIQLPLVRLIQTNIDRHRKNIANWAALLGKAREEIALIHNTLGQNATIMFAKPEAGGASAAAKRFESNVVIAANPASGAEPLDSAAVSIVLSSPINSPTLFKLSDGEIQRGPYQP